MAQQQKRDMVASFASFADHVFSQILTYTDLSVSLEL
jgi:hypothetical protein